MKRRLLTLVLCLAAPGAAYGNALDSFGFSAQGEALAGAMTAQAAGYAAAHYNPAGVAALAEAQVALSYSYGYPGVTINGKNAGVTPPHGLSLGAALPITIGPVRLALGLALYLPDQFMLRVQLNPIAEPRFVLLDNNLDHLVATPVIALRFGRWFELGGGVTILSDIAGHGVTFDVGITGGEKIGRGSIDVSIPIRLAPVAGLRLLPLPWLRVGVAYRGQIDLGVSLDVLARMNVANAVTGDVLIALRALNLYTPRKLSVGVAVDILPWLTLSCDLDWINWGAFQDVVSHVSVQLALGITPSLVETLFPSDHFRDILVPRLGLEMRRPVGSHIIINGRLGYAFEPSPVPPQTGLSSFVDNDRHIVGAGIGLALLNLIPFLEHPLRIDLGLQWQQLVSEITHKNPTLFPGEGFSSGGWLVHGTVTLEARF